jgi:DNA-binding NarL/FixJ family response regulator
MIKIIIADDHAIVREGLRGIIALDPEMVLAGEAAGGDEVLSMVNDREVDVVVLDLSMPGRTGLETLKELRRTHPNIAVIVLSMHPKDQYAVRVIKAGASAYLSKESASDELIAAIRKASRGEKYISPEVADLFAEYVIRGHDLPHKSLSDREFEVLRMIGSGKGITQISEELKLSVKTVSTYRSRIIEKTGLSNNSEMTRYVLEQKL